MKKRLFAVLMAVCLVLSTCVLFASAAEESYAKDELFVISSGKTLKKATDGKDYNIPFTVKEKSNVTLPVGTDDLSSAQIDEVYTFTANGRGVKYETELSKYGVVINAKVVAVSGGYEVQATFGTMDSKYMDTIYAAEEDFSKDGAVTTDDKVVQVKDKYYKYDTAGLTLNPVKVSLVSKLYSFETGIRFFGSTYDNLRADEIAKVELVVCRLFEKVEKDESGSEEKVKYFAGSTKVMKDKDTQVTVDVEGKEVALQGVKSVVNKVTDLSPNDYINVSASLKNKEDESFYKFYCWVDKNGNVVSTDESIYFKAGAYSALYATYVEIVDRVEIDYSAGENGSIAYFLDGSVTNREVFKGTGQVSVLKGKDATFVFTPDEGYEVATVKIDGNDITSILTVLEAEDKWDALKDLIAATNKEIYQYTFDAISGYHKVEVTFQKIAALEAPDGKDLPTVAPEGITLATGVAGEEAEGDAEATTVPAEKNNGSNGSDDGIVNPQTGSASAVAVFAVLSVAAGAAFVTSKKKD